MAFLSTRPTGRRTRSSSAKSLLLRKKLKTVEVLEERLNLSYTAPDGIVYPTAANGMPLLHSYQTAPSGPAPVAIYMDFDGDPETSGYAGFDEDGNAGNFNANEQFIIWESWYRTSEYFSMFSADVTTEKPANVTTTKTAWAVFTPDLSGWGYSGIGNFPVTSSGTYMDVYFGNYHPPGAAHEYGHSLGNFHTSTYDSMGDYLSIYGGPVDGSNPFTDSIMGNKGGLINKFGIYHDDGGVTTIENTSAVIASKIATAQGSGTGYKVDDFGGTTGTATSLTLNTIKRGVIETLGDTDVFSFTSTGGNYVVDVNRDRLSPVDTRITILNSSGTRIASFDGNPNYYSSREVPNDGHITLTGLASGTFYVQVQSHGSAGDLGSYLVNVSKFTDANWKSTDIGMVQFGGFSKETGTNTFELRASGDDIWNDHDALHFQYQTLKGDGTIIARVDSMDNTNEWAKAGIMVRDNLTDSAMYVSMFASSSNGPQMQRRATTLGQTDGYSNGGGAFSPIWLKLTRVGNTFTAYTSTNGTTWTQFQSPTTVALNASKVYVGLALTSHDNLKMNKTVFSNVSVVANGTGVMNPGPTVNATLPTVAAPTLASSVSGVVSQVVVTWTRSTNASVTAYYIERSVDGQKYDLLNTVTQPASGTTVSYTNSTNIADNNYYYYRVRTMNAAAEVSNIGTASSVLTVPGAILNLRSSSPSTTQIELEWTDIAGETGYQVQRSTDNATWSNLGSVQAANTCIFVNSSLAANTRYYYRVLSKSGTTTTATSNSVQGNTRLSNTKPSNFALTNRTQTNLSFTWTGVSGATKYTIERSSTNADSGSFTMINSNVTTTSFSDSTVTAGNRYFYRITAVSANGSRSRDTFKGTTISNPNPLPTGWSSSEINSGQILGTENVSGGSVTVYGSGDDMWDATDTAHFTNINMSNNGTVIAKITTFEGNAEWSRAGIMMRDTTNPDSRYAAMMMYPNHGAGYQSRTTTGGLTNQILQDPGNGTDFSETWLKMTRSGNIFTGYYSKDSTNGTDGTWTQMGQDTITMNSTIKVGLFVSSWYNWEISKAVFTNVTTPNGNLSGGSLKALGSFTSLAAASATLPGASLLSGASVVGPSPTAAADQAFSSYDEDATVAPSDVKILANQQVRSKGGTTPGRTAEQLPTASLLSLRAKALEAALDS